MKFGKGYPYIGKAGNGIVLLFAPKSAEWLTGRVKGERTSKFNENHLSENYGKEYLSYTYGKVESEEHREFIIALAKNSGFGCNDPDRCEWFCFDKDVLTFLSVEYHALSKSRGGKRITISMPEEKHNFKGGQRVYLAQINPLAGVSEKRYFFEMYWFNSGHQKEYVDCGILFDNKKDAENRCKSLLGIPIKTDEELLRDALQSLFNNSTDSAKPTSWFVYKTIELLKKYSMRKD